MADKERSYEGAVLPSPTSGPAFASELPSDLLSTPPRLAGAVASPSPPAPPHPSAGRAVRRLGLGNEPDAAALAPSCPGSPDVICSQLRLQEVEEWPEGGLSRRYPTPPPAPPKDQYISPSELESESSPPPPAKIFRRGQLMYHAAHKGPVPIAFVDTGIYAGGKHDFYEAYDERDLLWTRRMDHVLKCLGVQRWKR
jgi:hypothetical protein